jgi:hypothetical protein
MMINFTAAVGLINEEVVGVKCVFTSQDVLNSAKHYTYKTLLKDLKAGDTLAVKFSRGFGMALVSVVEVDVPLEFENPNINYQWAFQKLDVDLLEAIENEEKLAVNELRKEDMKARQTDIRERFFKAQPDVIDKIAFNPLGNVDNPVAQVTTDKK